MDTIVKHTFDFENSAIRVLGEPDNPWFVAKDICNILGLKNVSDSTKNIPDKWKGVEIIYTPSGNQNMLILSEPAVYKLIMRSNKPTAQKFQDWIFEEVLPSIRKTGEYKLQTTIKTQTKEIEELNRLLHRKLRKTHNKGNSVYVVKNPDIDGKYKIGCTKDIDRRLKDYGGASPHDYELLRHVYVEPMKSVEDILLFIFDKHRCQSDFKGSKKREWVELDHMTIVQELDDLCDYIISRRKEYDDSYDKTPELVEEDIETEPTKECIACNTEKSLDEFYTRKDNKDGIENICKKCYVNRQLKAREAKRINLLKGQEKKCRKCKKLNPLSMYKKHPTSKDGFSYICSKCTVKPILSRTEKVCSCCKVEKDIEEFNNCRTSSDGKFAYCRPCTKMKNAKYKKKIRSKDLSV